MRDALPTDAGADGEGERAIRDAAARLAADGAHGALDKRPAQGRVSLDDFMPREPGEENPPGANRASPDDVPDGAALPVMGRVGVDDFPDPAADAAPTFAAGGRVPARVPDEQKPPGTRAQKIRTAFFAVCAVGLIALFWPASPRGDALLARLPAAYRLGVEFRAAKDFMRQAEDAELFARFMASPLGMALSRLEPGGEGDAVPAFPPEGALSDRSPGAAARAVHAALVDWLASPGGAGLSAGAWNGSIVLAAADASLDDLVFAANTMAAAKIWFTWRHWREGEAHSTAGRVWRRTLPGGRAVFLQPVGGLVVGATRPERLPALAAALRDGGERPEPPAWARRPARPAVLFHWAAAAEGGDAPAPEAAASRPARPPAPEAAGEGNPGGDRPAILPAGHAVTPSAAAGPTSAGRAADAEPASPPDETAPSPMDRIARGLAAMERALAARGLAEANVALVVNRRRLHAAGMGAFAPGVLPAAPFADASPVDLNEAPAFPGEAMALAFDHARARAAGRKPPLLPPALAAETPGVALYGRVSSRALWRKLGRVVWGEAGHPLRGVAATPALLVWEAVETGLVAGMDGRWALSVGPPPLTVAEASVPLAPEVFFAAGVGAGPAFDERLDAGAARWIEAIRAPGGDPEMETLRRTVRLVRRPGERHTVRRLDLPALLVNYAEPAWTVLRDADRNEAVMVFASHAPRLVRPVSAPPPAGDAAGAPPSWLSAAVRWRTGDEAFSRAFVDAAREATVTRADVHGADARDRARVLDWLEAALASVPDGYLQLHVPYADASGPDADAPTPWSFQLLLNAPDEAK